MFHSVASGLDTLDRYVKTTVAELDNQTLNVFNQTVDEVDCR